MNTKKFYYTYVLRSIKDCKLYIGWVDNLKARIIKHNKGLVKSTKNRLPIQLVYYEACLTKQKAILREKSLKTGFGRKYLKNRI
ncbi:excinuclease ABC subunit C [Candidatus Woesebacteria bacterium RBG_16_34_12]|uniref:Excinuclease ABC subunit C n=1 Tax=Candidatus Woesebacteria bacterium RBG_16_34_12 TaxID=1802480 RepID=A0A1F7XAM1_9BACT|nr:MAG: excinuclease ABC subunit C [Candidatus Woesebacteria bacterium RBG_16_34_12]